MLKYGIIRYSTRGGPDDQKILRVDSEQLRLKLHGVTSLDLSEISNLPLLQRIDIGDNRIEEIDLEPLSECNDLRYLDLSGNRINKINLSPLANCTQLERLDLSHNKITNLDLCPLMKCQNLSVFYVHFNKMNAIDITPLLMCPNLTNVDTRGIRNQIIGVEDSDSKIRNPTLFVDPIFQIALANNYPTWIDLNKSDTKISSVSYEKLVPEHGWSYVKRIIIRTISMVGKKLLPSIQSVLLKTLGMSELIGYEGKVLDILDLIPENSSFSEGTNVLYSSLIPLIQKQLDNNGSTRLFDVSKLANTRASVLIPLLLRKRKEEIENIVIPIHGKRINLRKLHATGYGFQILTALGIGKTTTLTGFKRIQKAFSKLDIQLAVDSCSQSSNAAKQVISDTS